MRRVALDQRGGLLRLGLRLGLSLGLLFGATPRLTAQRAAVSPTPSAPAAPSDAAQLSSRSTAQDAHDADVTHDTHDARPDDPAALEILSRVDGELFADSFLLSGRMLIERAGADHEVGLRVHHYAPRHTAIEAARHGRHNGTVYLMHPDGLTVWFARARLLLDLPAGAAGQRLFGSHLSLEDLALLMGARERFRVQLVGAEELDGVAVQHLLLTRRAPRLSQYTRVELWLRSEDGAPLAYEARDERGRRLRQIHFSRHRDGSPRTWTARDHDEGQTVLHWGSPEPGLHREPSQFSPSGLSAWR